MCILFAYVADNPQPDSFKVIMGVNRDEVYRRPTKEAMFWGTDPDIVGGRDMEPGREGGTWLAMNKTGKIAALLNIVQSKEEMANSQLKRGRGFLVNNFLKSSKTGMEYLTEIAENAHEYNPFTLFTLDSLTEKSPQICYYTCYGNNKPTKLTPGTVYGIGNSFIGTPFQKVKSGKEIFAGIIQENNHVTKQTNLINGILTMLKDEQRFHPDPQIEKLALGQPETFISGISSRFVKLPGYGTRTHTIILIDYNNQVFYQELTLTDPVTNNNGWSDSKFEFKITKDC